MIDPPFTYALTDAELAQVARFLLTCSHIDYLLGHCLRSMLRLSSDESIVMVFPLTIEQRLQKIVEVDKINPLNDAGRAALAELKTCIKAIQPIRNDVAHAILLDGDEPGSPVFHNRAKEREFAKDQVLSVGELANYAAHVALSLRFAIGENGEPYRVQKALPERPPIPEFLRSYFQEPKAQEKAEPRRPPPA